MASAAAAAGGGGAADGEGEWLKVAELRATVQAQDPNAKVSRRRLLPPASPRPVCSRDSPFAFVASAAALRFYTAQLILVPSCYSVK
jgi:hypothetical protein